jgi:D-amino-acid dehydrogenase
MDIIFGAGIIGVSTALHLQSRGQQCLIIDNNGVGNGASFGNAGLIERTDLLPRSFPRSIFEILRYATNTNPILHYKISDIFTLTPWLLRYWWNSSDKNIEKIANNISELFLKCLDEHEAFAKAANTNDLLHASGWLHLSRNKKTLKKAMIGVERANDMGMKAFVLDSEQIAKAEPLLKEKFAWGIHWQDSASISNPSEYVKRLANLFVARGGMVLKGDANSLKQTKNGWSAKTNEGIIKAENAVIALGINSDIIFKPLGYKIPFASKRGYHMEYEYKDNNRLNIPIIDADNGFVLTPMQNGTRLTTAIEFAKHRSKPTPFQLEKTEPIAHSLLEMGERQLKKPWLGSRPCTADMMPVIGKAPNHKGLWFNFGHAHHGLTLGPISGRLLAEIMNNEKPIIDPKAFSVERFV